MKYLLDTNTCIYIINRSPRQVYQHFQRLQVGDVGISAITFCELQFGVSNSQNPDKNQRALTTFLGPLDIIDFPAGTENNITELAPCIALRCLVNYRGSGGAQLPH